MLDSPRPLAVSTRERLPAFPEVPTAKEQGIDWEAVGWRGLALPKDTPDDVAARLSAACEKIAKSDEYKQFMEKTGYTIEIRSAAEFAAFLAQQDEQWKPVIEAANYAKQP